MTESERSGLAELFADVARQLQAESPPEKTQDRVTRAALVTIDGCDAITERQVNTIDAMLRRASQHLHRRPREVAVQVVDTGQIPDEPARPT